MDHSWRLRPPVQGNICPTCSVSHFPFCPPHPSFNQNPRFQTHHDHSFQRPLFDPFLDHRGPTAGLHRPFVGDPSDGFGDPRAWHRDPNLERESYGQFHGQSQIGDSGMVTGFDRDGFAPPRYDHGNVGFKRTRVDETGMGSFTNENHLTSSRNSAENERRLRLIRDHGGAPSGPPQGGANSGLGMSSGFNFETKGYVQESSVIDKNFSGMDGGERRKFDELPGSGNDRALKPPRNFEMNNFQDLGFGNFDREGTSLHPEPGFNPHNYGEEHGLTFEPRYTWSNRNEELGQSRYGQLENSLHPSLQTNGHSGLLDGGSTNVKQGQQGQDVAVPYHEGGRYNSNLGDGYLSNLQKGDLEVLNENYYHHNFQRGYPIDSMLAKEPGHSHPTNRQGLSGLSAQYHEQRGNFPMENHNPNSLLPQPYTMQPPMQPKHDFQSPGHLSDMRQSFEVNVPSQDGNQGLVGHRNLNKQGGYLPIPAGSNMFSENMGPIQASRVSNVQPPLPASPPPPLPLDPPRHLLSEPYASSSPPETSSTLFPIPMSSSAAVPSSHPPVPEHFLPQPFFHNKPHLHASTGFATEESQVIQRTSSKKYLEEDRRFLLRHLSSDKPKVIDASHIFKQPHRAKRPDHIVIILRGLPGSGKSYLAKMLRDLEVESGGDAPRIHSMDDYFMTEVEKVEDSEVSKSSGFVRAKKPVMKKIMEYCYEPEMEEAYRSSMLKAFKKTLEEGVFSFIIVDDRNLRVADFAQFWATAKRSGYEVYLLEAAYKDPVGCAARNVHGFTQDDIQRMAREWEEAPSLYLKLDIKSLFHGDDLKESGIQEVDMDTEDGDSDGHLSILEEKNPEKIIVPPAGDILPDGSSKDENTWDAEAYHTTEDVKELGRSKWSADFDEDDAQRIEAKKRNLNALSGLVQAYGKEGKSVHWGDQVGNTGFSIGAAKKANMLSLVIGPGDGYNSKSNPLPQEENLTSTQITGESKGRNIFQERIRAERESFRVVFDKRRQRIGGLDAEEE